MNTMNSSTSPVGREPHCFSFGFMGRIVVEPHLFSPLFTYKDRRNSYGFFPAIKINLQQVFIRQDQWFIFTVRHPRLGTVRAASLKYD